MAHLRSGVSLSYKRRQQATRFWPQATQAEIEAKARTGGRTTLIERDSPGATREASVQEV